MHRLSRHRSDLLALLTILLLALLWFAPVLFPSLSGKGLLPYDNLYAFEPWRSLHPDLIPHNELLSDLVLENMVWKQHTRQTLAAGELPLWNPQIFTGIPFLAGGQSSVFYPLSLLFYLLPLDAAYGWFTALQVALAGVNMYILGRVLRLRPPAALLAGVVYMFSGFLMVSVVFTMFLAATPWLPLLLAVIEVIIGKQERKGVASFRPIPYVIVGAVVIGLVALAGHPELIYYMLIVAALYSLMRLLVAWRAIHHSQSTIDNSPPGHGSIVRRLFILSLWLLAMSVLGLALGAVQLIPLVELLPLNFRAGSVSLQQVLEWAWPTRQILTFFLPNIFGSPSHHHWFDLWNGQWVQATVNVAGAPAETIFWGVKNYVEGGNYLSIAAWLLAAVAVVSALIQAAPRRRGQSDGQRVFAVWFFLALSVVSLLFAFGSPLYALLYYGLPGWNQLHSPFRWVFPFTLSMAVLAGWGLNVLWVAVGRGQDAGSGGQVVYRLIAIAAMLVGAGVLLLVLASRVAPDPFIALGERILASSDLSQAVFADGRMFWGYQSLNLLQFGFFALLAGLLVWLLTRNAAGQPSRTSSDETLPASHSQFTIHRLPFIISIVLTLLIVADLFLAHGRFNPAVDVTLAPTNEQNIPAAVRFIQEREANQSPASWRFTTFNLPGEKTFNANVGMVYGWHDIRGYDSIIPRQYVAFMDRIAPQENELLYNRIAPLYSNVTGDPYAILDNPLLDLLNVKYVLTEHVIPNPGWQEIYRDDSIGIYENREVMPRAFIAHEARVASAADQPLLESNLRSTVLIEESPADPNALNPASPQLADARISRATANEVFVDVNLSDRGWLVLTNAFFPGWKAYVRPFGGGENEEVELPIQRANGAFWAVYLPRDGQWTVRFVYTPMSFKLGLYVSFLAGMALLLLGLYWAWGRYYRPEATTGEARTVAKNSLAPMLLSLTNKVIDFAFAMLYVRLLGPADTGKWYFVVALYGFFEIISRYGLGTLLTRDVAEDKNRSSRYLTNVLGLRTLLWLATLPVLAAVTYFYHNLGSLDITVLGYHLGSARAVNIQPIGLQEVQAIAILAFAMLFANWADAFSSTFFAFEKMEYPAGLTSAMAMLKVSLGALVLLLGWGFVGLAVVSLFVNVVQVSWLYLMVRSTLFKPQWIWDWPLQKNMFRVSGPLMINHLLATIFWRIDIWILRPLAGAVSVGLYSIGLKYMDGLNIIPSMFTMALFPLMSRYARREGDNLLRSYVLSLRLLVMVSLPIALAVTFLARLLVFIVGGVQYLDVPGVLHVFGREIPYMGGADLALQIIIWSIPIGFVNSVTQYVLIAVHQQRRLTRAFIIGVVFNVTGNLLLIPSFGYVAAAITTILSEFSLLFPFYYSVRCNVGVVPWASIFVRPAAATLLMGLTSAALIGLGMIDLLAVAVGGLVYIAALALSGAFRSPDMEVIVRVLPAGRLRHWFLSRQT
jgi:O-antigen/teichoic acid export membrane protein